MSGGPVKFGFDGFSLGGNGGKPLLYQRKFASPMAQGVRSARSCVSLSSTYSLAARSIAAKYAEFDLFEQRLRSASQGEIPSG